MISVSKLNNQERNSIIFQFTEELIKTVAKKNGLNLEKLPGREIPKIRERMPLIPEIRNQRKLPGMKFTQTVDEYKKSAVQVEEPSFIPVQRKSFTMNIPTPMIPQPKLPPRFQYLKPLPSDKRIELGKLNPFIRDPMVNSIECNGPGEEIIVVGKFGRKRTGVMLDKEEINQIVNMFAIGTKIPVGEGVYNVVYGKLTFSAIISDVLGAKFIIKKMIYNPVFR